MMNASKSIPELSHVDAVRRHLRREVRLKNLFGLVTFSGIVLFAVGAVLAVLGFFSLRHPLNAGFLWALACGQVVLLAIPVTFLLGMRRYSQRLRETARQLDRRNPHLLDAYQTLLSWSNHGPETQEKLDALYGKQLREKKPVSLGRSWFKACRWGLAGVLVWVAGAGFSRQWQGYASRTLAPLAVLHDLPRLWMEITAPSMYIGAGDSLSFSGRAVHLLPGQNLYVHISDDRVERRHPLKYTGPEFSFRYGPVHRNTRVFVQGANGRSNTLIYRVAPLPRFAGIQVVLTPPDYTGLTPDTLVEGLQDFSLLPGTRVQWLLKASNPVDNIQAVLRHGGNEEDTTYHFEPESAGQREFSITRRFHPGKGGFEAFASKFPYQMAFSLKEATGVRNPSAGRGTLELRRDAKPAIEILRPNRLRPNGLQPEGDALLPKNRKLPVVLRLMDDYGFSLLKARYRILSDGFVKDSSEIPLNHWLKKIENQVVENLWDLSELPLYPGNHLALEWIACDNDNFSGPKCAVSEMVVLKQPTIQEVLALAEREEKEVLRSLKGAVEKQKQVEKQLERMQSKTDEAGNDFRMQFEVQRILSVNPSRLARQGEALQEKLKEAARREKTNPPQLSPAQKSLEAFRKNIPSGQWDPRREEQHLKEMEALKQAQEKALETQSDLHKAMEEREKTQSQKTQSQKPQSQKSLPPELTAQMNKWEADMRENLEQQEQIRDYLQARENQAKHQERLKEKALQGQEQSLQQMQKGMRELEEFLQESSEKELFSEDFLEKLEKVQDLLHEVIPDSLRDMIQRKMSGEQVDAEALKESLQNLMENRHEFEQNVNQAIAMLEQLREAKKFSQWSREAEALAEREKQLAGDIGEQQKAGTSDSPEKQSSRKQSLQKKQRQIRKETEQLLEQIRQSKNASAPKSTSESLESLLENTSPTSSMKNVEQSLNREGGSGMSQAGEQAGEAAQQLQQMAQGFQEMFQAMDPGNFQLDLALVERMLQESLQTAKVLELSGMAADRREAKGWESSTQSIMASVQQVARWMYLTLRDMGKQNPFISGFLIRNAQLTSDALEAYLESRNPRHIAEAGQYNHRVARELLKLMKQAQGGSGSGSGNQSMPSGGPPSEQLQGMSGQQMAINQATQQLLKTMLEARQPGGRDGQSGRSGSQELANEQGQLSEAVEGLAESLPSSEGAAGKLRRLAQEAREIEKELRRGATSGTLNRQEKFQARLLETARSLREKGRSKEREGRAFKGAGWSGVGQGGKAFSDWAELVEKEWRKAQKLPLTPEQKKTLETYFKKLLTE